VLTLHVKGIAMVHAGLDRFRQRYADALEAGLFLTAQRVMDQIVPGVPVDTGTLVESRAVTRTSPVQIVFGSPHAVFSHARSKKRRWLQVPFSRMSPQYAAWIARATAQAFRAQTTLASAPASHPETPQMNAAPRRARPRAQRRPR
jgi:hypothetical protein